MMQFHFSSHHFPGSNPASSVNMKRQLIPGVMAIPISVPFLIMVGVSMLDSVRLFATHW
jgi:hypothetical protein